jgi:hypothetical protein
VNALLLAAGALVVAGGIAVVTARRPAAVAVGTFVLLGASPLLIDPLPPIALLLARIVGAGLAAELVWLAVRGRTLGGASPLAWPGVSFVAAAAFVAGLGIGAAWTAGLTGDDMADVSALASPEALAAALALFAVVAVSAVGRPDGLHLAFDALVLIVAASVFRLALDGPASSLETLLVAGAGIAVAGAAALLAGERRPAPAAHRIAGRATATDASVPGTLVGAVPEDAAP